MRRERATGSLDAALRPVLASTLRFAVKPVLAPAVPFSLQRAWTTVATRASTIVPPGTRVRSERPGGVATERLSRADSSTGQAVIYLHGGGFCIGSPANSRAIGARLAERTGAPVYVPDYRLAPEHPYPAAFDDALAVYRALLHSGFAPEAIAFAGDSAGAGLALSLLAGLRERGLPQPASAVLFSPWVDLSLSGASLAFNAAIDPLLGRAWLELCARAYCGTLDPRDPRVSPLFADLRDIAPLAIHVGTREILLDDAARLAERARSAGVEVAYRRFEGLWHNSQLQAGVLPSASVSFADAGRFVRDRWIAASSS
jgi:acetyl esterase/lipase